MLGKSIFGPTARVQKASYICLFCRGNKRNGCADAFVLLSGSRRGYLTATSRARIHGIGRQLKALDLQIPSLNSHQTREYSDEVQLQQQPQPQPQLGQQQDHGAQQESKKEDEHKPTLLPNWNRAQMRAEKGRKRALRSSVKGSALDAKGELLKIVRKIARRTAANAAEEKEKTDLKGASEDAGSKKKGVSKGTEPKKSAKVTEPAAPKDRLKNASEVAKTAAKAATAATADAEAKTTTKQKKEGSDFKKNDLSKFLLKPVKVKQDVSAPRLAHGLDRVLFNPGVCFLQDPRSRVYNFDPYLENIMPVADFDFTALRDYITSSKDAALATLAQKTKSKYVGSTSSMTGVLSQFHYLISKWRPINTKMMSQGFKVEYDSFAKITRLPASIFLRYKDGIYAIDADKEFDEETILSLLGHSLEKLLTLEPSVYDKFHKTKSHQLPNSVRKADDLFQYTVAENILMRSQLDAHDSRLPGSGMFDLKTRSVVSIRMRPTDTSVGAGYQIKTADGQWESFEREYYDMIRSAFLKYSLQVRIGRMDGIFVTYHNTERIFGFQYVSIDELDQALHGSSRIGELEYRYSLSLLSKALDAATAKFPKQSLRLHFETRPYPSDFMYIFAEPISEEKIEDIQSSKRRQMERYAREVQRNIQRKQKAAKSADEPKKSWLGSSKAMSDGDRDAAPQGLFNQGQEGEDATLAEDTEPVAVDESSREDFEVISTEGLEGMLSSDGDESPEASTSIQDESDPSVSELKPAEVTTATADLGPAVTEEPTKVTEDKTMPSASEATGSTGLSQGQLTATTADPKSSDLQPEVDSEIVPPGDEKTSASEEEFDGFLDEIAGELAKAEAESAEPAEQAEENVYSNDKGVAESAKDSPGSTDGGADLSKLANKIRSDLSQFKEDCSKTELIGLTLEVKNWVNKQETRRPDQLEAYDKWNITFAFKEITSETQARLRYEQLRKRRIDGLTRVGDTGNNRYFENLEKLSREGRRWLEQQKKMDAKKRTVVFSPVRGSPRGFQGSTRRSVDRQ